MAARCQFFAQIMPSASLSFPPETERWNLFTNPVSLILGLWPAGLAVIVLACWLIAIPIRRVKIKLPSLFGP